MSDDIKVEKTIDENTELPDYNTPMTGNVYEGLRLFQEWRPRIKARQEIGNRVRGGQAVSEEEERIRGEVCDEVDKLGIGGIGQLITHLMSLQAQVNSMIGVLAEEMHNHFDEEIAEMERRAGVGQADPFSGGVKEVA